MRDLATPVLRLLMLLSAAPALGGDEPVIYGSFGSNEKLLGKSTPEWTGGHTVCDPVRMELLKEGYLNQEPASVLTKLEKSWDSAIEMFSSAKKIGCAPSLGEFAGTAEARLQKMKSDVMPGVRMEACQGPKASSQERLRLIRQAVANIEGSEKALEGLLVKNDAIFKYYKKQLTEARAAPAPVPVVAYDEDGEEIAPPQEQKSCAAMSSMHWYVARVEVNTISCELLFAKTRLKALLARTERGIASVAACETDRPSKEEKEEAASKALGNANQAGSARPNESDITGIP